MASRAGGSAAKTETLGEVYLDGSCDREHTQAALHLLGWPVGRRRFRRYIAAAWSSAPFVGFRRAPDGHLVRSRKGLWRPAAGPLQSACGRSSTRRQQRDLGSDHRFLHALRLTQRAQAARISSSWFLLPNSRTLMSTRH